MKCLLTVSCLCAALFAAHAHAAEVVFDFEKESAMSVAAVGRKPVTRSLSASRNTLGRGVMAELLLSTGPPTEEVN